MVHLWRSTNNLNNTKFKVHLRVAWVNSCWGLLTTNGINFSQEYKNHSVPCICHPSEIRVSIKNNFVEYLTSSFSGFSVMKIRVKGKSNDTLSSARYSKITLSPQIYFPIPSIIKEQFFYTGIVTSYQAIRTQTDLYS